MNTKHYIAIALIGELLDVTASLKSRLEDERTLDEFVVYENDVIDVIKALRAGIHSQLSSDRKTYENTIETRGTFAGAKRKYGVKE